MNKAIIKQGYFWIYVWLLLLMVIFYGVVHIYPNYSDQSILHWVSTSWSKANNYEHGWFVIPAMLIFYYMSWRAMSNETVAKNWCGWIILLFGIFCYFISIRSLQPRFALFGFPFIVSGSVLQLCGWNVARHIMFPSFFLYFAIPLPGLQHATNGLQIFVTGACFHTGEFFGMDIIREGNVIKSANGSWNALDIAEGCSGIRSLIALIMISAIFAYYTQKTIFKKVFVFSLAIPLAVIGNFFRIFTIILLAEMGYADFAAGAYHDWAGLLIFFPIALAGLFIADTLLNRRKKKRVKTKIIR